MFVFRRIIKKYFLKQYKTFQHWNNDFRNTTKMQLIFVSQHNNNKEKKKEKRKKLLCFLNKLTSSSPIGNQHKIVHFVEQIKIDI